MAEIDVSELLLDPDFIDSFGVLRQQQSVDGHGRAHGAGSPITAFGSVQAASGRSMELLPDMTHVSGAIEIWTKFRLEGPSDTTQADIVMWHGRTYQVQQVQPWTNYGQGFIHAVCTLYELLAKAPTNRPVDHGI